jgi:sporulation protein YlmC with PRC-barrel domain
MDRLFQDRQQPQVMRLTGLRGMPLVDPGLAQRIGVVADALIDPIAGRLAALDIQTGEEGGLERMLAEAVRRVGQHAVMLDAARAGGASAPGEADRWVDLRALVGLEVLADSGDRVGNLADALIDPDTLDVNAYELDKPFWERWLGGGGLIRPEDVVACSHELMIVISARRAPEPIAAPGHAGLPAPTERITYEGYAAPEAPPSPPSEAAYPPADRPSPTIHEEPTIPHPVVRSVPLDQEPPAR